MSLYESILKMDPDELEAFRKRLRRRYTRDEIIDDLKSCAARLGKSPTMREFGDDTETLVHPQTVVEHFGSWNAAKREAGLMPRREATQEELIAALQNLGEAIGRTPTLSDLARHKGLVPGKSVYLKTFGSFRKALSQSGFDAPSRQERLHRSIDFAAAHLRETGHLPSFREWDDLRGPRTDLLSAWQIYRMFDETGGSWSAFQCAVDRIVREDVRDTASV